MEYKAYSLGNMYLGGVQAGIQAAHALSRIPGTYPVDSTGYRQWRRWAINDETIILLNGGMSCHLQEAIELFEDLDNPYPWAAFYESEEALNGALTNVSIVVPDKIWDYEPPRVVEPEPINGCIPMVHIETAPKYEYTEWELKLAQFLKSKRLMG